MNLKVKIQTRYLWDSTTSIYDEVFSLSSQDRFKISFSAISRAFITVSLRISLLFP